MAFVPTIATASQGPSDHKRIACFISGAYYSPEEQFAELPKNEEKSLPENNDRQAQEETNQTNQVNQRLQEWADYLENPKNNANLDALIPDKVKEFGQQLEDGNCIIQ